MRIKPQKILLLTAMHGDEKMGRHVLQKLQKEKPGKFTWIIANEQAQKTQIRFVDADLNRVAPGIKDAKEYEVRRAYELLKIVKDYKYLIDIHDTIANSGIFTIITNLKLENLFLAVALPIRNIVIWASKKSKKIGPLTRFVSCGIEIECGPRNSKKIQEQLYDIIKSIIDKGIVFDKKSISSKVLFQVYGKFTKSEFSKKHLGELKDFKKVKIKDESFYPLLVGQYEDAICYKMKRINFWDKFAC